MYTIYIILMLPFIIVVFDFCNLVVRVLNMLDILLGWLSEVETRDNNGLNKIYKTITQNKLRYRWFKINEAGLFSSGTLSPSRFLFSYSQHIIFKPRLSQTKQFLEIQSSQLSSRERADTKGRAKSEAQFHKFPLHFTGHSCFPGQLGNSFSVRHIAQILFGKEEGEDNDQVGDSLCLSLQICRNFALVLPQNPSYEKIYQENTQNTVICSLFFRFKK